MKNKYIIYVVAYPNIVGLLAGEEFDYHKFCLEQRTQNFILRMKTVKVQKGPISKLKTDKNSPRT